MKYRLWLMISLLPALSGSRQPDYPLRISHVKGNLYAYQSYGTYGGKHYPANALYLVTKKGVVLLDTPWDPRYYQPLLDSIRARHHQKVVMCLSTHFHDDRTGGLAYYASRGVKTYTTRQTDSLCRVNHNPRARYLITADTTFHIGGSVFQTYYPGAGHTRDNIVVWFPRLRVLYGGCLIKSTEDTSLGNLQDADVKRWGNSLRRLQKNFPHPDCIIVGHNGWKDKHSIDHTLRMLLPYNSEHGS